MNYFMTNPPKPTTYKTLIADVNPDHAYQPSIDRHLCDWETSLNTTFSGQSTEIIRRFTGAIPDTYKLLLAPTYCISHRVPVHVPPPLDNNDRTPKKKKRAEYKHSSTPGEAYKLFELRPNSSLKGKTPQEIKDYLSSAPKLFGRTLCIPYLIKVLQFQCPNHDTCTCFHLDGKKLPPNIQQRSYIETKK